MADNYLENQYENYLARKAAMSKKTTKKKNIIKVERLQSEAIDALKDIIAQPSFRMPFDIFREHLYSADSLYKGYQLGKARFFQRLLRPASVPTLPGYGQDRHRHQGNSCPHFARPFHDQCDA